MLLLPELRENPRKNSKMIGLNGNALIQSIGYQNALRIGREASREPNCGSEGASRERDGALPSGRFLPVTIDSIRFDLDDKMAMQMPVGGAPGCHPSDREPLKAKRLSDQRYPSNS